MDKHIIHSDQLFAPQYWQGIAKVACSYTLASLLLIMLMLSQHCFADKQPVIVSHVNGKDTDIKHCLTFQEGREYNRIGEGDIEIHRYLMHVDSAKLKATQFYSTTYDLNDDGRPEYFHVFVGSAAPPFCGGETCTLRVYDFCGDKGCGFGTKAHGYTKEELHKIEAIKVAEIALPIPSKEIDLETINKALCVLHTADKGWHRLRVRDGYDYKVRDNAHFETVRYSHGFYGRKYDYSPRYTARCRPNREEYTVLTDFDIKNRPDPHAIRVWYGGGARSFLIPTEFRITDERIQFIKGRLYGHRGQRVFVTYYEESHSKSYEPILLADEWDCKFKDNKGEEK